MMNASTDACSESPIRIGVTPQKSSYFAGEVLQALPRKSRSPGHKRASHSISSVQLHRPPTSPGPTVAANFPAPSQSNTTFSIPHRRGLVGSKKKSRSFSVDLSAITINSESYQVETDSSTPLQSQKVTLNDSKRELRISSIHPKHPHARKASIDVGLHSPSIPTQGGYHPPSSLSGSLDSISEMGSLDTSSTRTKESAFQYSSPSRVEHHQRRVSFPSPKEPKRFISPSDRPRPVSNFNLPMGSEHLVYGYVHLHGYLLFDKSVNIRRLQEDLLSSKTFGGGSLEIMESKLSRTPSGTWSSSSSTSLELENGKISVFDFQSEPMFVDLILSPEEERSFSFETKLPSPLPPTYKGKFVKVEYQLSIGVSRARRSGDSHGPNYLSRIMNIPLRIYNRILGSIPQEPYNMRAVERRPRLQANVFAILKPDPELSSSRPSLSDITSTELWELQNYAKQLSYKWSGETQQLEAPEEDGPKSSREEIEVLTRMSRSHSYAIDKNGHCVATLVLSKMSYRLGESVIGIVEINQSSKDWTSALKMLIRLETVEQLPESLLYDPGTGQYTPRQHIRTLSEYHISNCSKSTRLSFTLDIPSDGTPGFELYDGARSGTPQGLSWQLRFQVIVTDPNVSMDDLKPPHPQSRKGRGLIRDNLPSEWEYTYTASDSFAPVARFELTPKSQNYKGSWLSYLIPAAFSVGMADTEQRISGVVAENLIGEDPVVGNGSRHWKGKGKEGLVEPDGLGEEHEWRRLNLEMIECIIPLTVWPGSTLFKHNEISFSL